ncbi:MAG: hypothetical protein IH624_04770 [Phycisphaerae bacterium]|nr:hypothetical protein [Phycisphaerae bacterium]
MSTHRKNGGWLLTEAVVVLAVMVVFFTALVSATATCRHLNWLLLIRQQCLSAARAQLDSVVATGRPMNAGDIRRLWPGLTVSSDIHDGRGQWEGLKCCVVTASARVRKRDVEIRLCRYYRPVQELYDAQP